MTGRIILIGMPAGGKTTIGAALSRALSVPLYDADALTEQTAGRSFRRSSPRRARLPSVPWNAGRWKRSAQRRKRPASSPPAVVRC